MKKILVLGMYFLSITSYTDGIRASGITNSNKQLNQIDINELYSIKQFTSFDLTKISSEKVYIDSQVIFDEDGILKNIDGIKKKGKFSVVLDSKLDSINNADISQQQQEVIQNSVKINESYKLAFDQITNQEFITSGRLIVKFKQDLDSELFAEKFELNKIFVQSDIYVFGLNDINRINEVIGSIQSDPRIESVYLDRVSVEINTR